MKRPNKLDMLVYRFFYWWWNPIFQHNPKITRFFSEHIFAYVEGYLTTRAADLPKAGEKEEPPSTQLGG